MKILQELRQIEREKLIQPQTPVISEKSGNVFSILMRDQSLSNKDFAGEITKWFRRSIWFLTFTAAYTISPPLLVIAVSINRDLDSVGAVGAAAPTCFEEIIFCTLNFIQRSL